MATGIISRQLDTVYRVVRVIGIAKIFSGSLSQKWAGLSSRDETTAGTVRPRQRKETSPPYRDPDKATFTAGRMQTYLRYRRRPPEARGHGGVSPPEAENDMKETNTLAASRR